MRFKKYLIISLLLLTGFSGGLTANFYLPKPESATAVDLRLDDQEAAIRAIKKAIPAVVNVIIMDQRTTTIVNLDTGEQTKKTDLAQKGSGTGFLISADGLILTNKHVVNAANEKTGQYKILLNSGKRYDAQLVGKDPINDLAVLKISDKNLPFVQLGDSDKLQLGATVIAIGNALGRYQNSVTKGIVSGLGRSIEASDQTGATAEALDNVIQIDAEINPGNSGGPLIDLNGSIVGINVALDQSASAIGFALPINDAKQVVRSVKEIGRIVRPRLGIKYAMITPELVDENKLSKSSGAWITVNTDGTRSILPNSPAAKAGLSEGDIITEINGIKLEGRTTLLSVVQRYSPGNKIGLKVFRDGRFIILTATLDEFK
ncbi:MAG: trypsin-like peptidase domain-containing protein [bacterium]|nr:trypsin-like peptidase domain-containing protein [bacterium]